MAEVTENQDVAPTARDLPVAFPGVRLRVARDHLLLESGGPLAIVSSAPHGSGTLRAKRILSSHVAKGTDMTAPLALIAEFATNFGVRNPFVGLLTAVELNQAAVVERERDGMMALAIATAGVGNAMNAAHGRPVAAAPVGTINLILLVDAQPEPGALINAVITATEAKTLALFERGVRTSDGLAATGTSTDAVVIGATMRGQPQLYAGPATSLGTLIGEATYAATLQALANSRPLPQPSRNGT